MSNKFIIPESFVQIEPLYVPMDALREVGNGMVESKINELVQMVNRLIVDKADKPTKEEGEWK